MTLPTKRLFLVISGAVLCCGIAAAQLLNQHEIESTNFDRFTNVQNDHGWSLPSRHQGQLSADVLTWMSQHFSNTVIVGQNIIGDPVLPVQFVKAVNFEVLQPSLLRRTLAMDLTIPSTHSVFVFKDSRGYLYTAVIEKYGSRFYVREVGPALDHTPEATGRPLSQRRLISWPPERTQLKGKLVFVPYPRPANQIFFQSGSDPATATFEDLNSGMVTVGMNSILDRSN